MSPRLGSRNARILYTVVRCCTRGGLTRVSSVLALLIVISMGTLILPDAAAAQSAPRLQDQLTDQTRSQILASSRSQIEAALTNLRDTRNVQLFVLFVETTGSQPVTDFADEVARRSSLGGNDVLLVVAVTDRSDALWRGAQMMDRLTDRELSDILSDRVEPRLARGDFAVAVVAAAEGVGQAVVSAGASASQPTGGSSLSLAPILLVVIFAVAGLSGWSAYSTRRRQRRAEADRERQTEQLSQEANALLIQADDALRDADEEIAFAEAQFSEAEIVPFREAVAHASTELKAAFTLRQQLDDDAPDTPDTRRAMVEQILQHAAAAQTALLEQKQRLDQLRDLERRAPEILTELPNQLDRVEARIPEIERTLTHLQRYADASWSSVAGNVDQARKRLVDARRAVDEGQRALTVGDRAQSGRAARTGQQGLGEAAQLLDAVQSLSAAIQEAETSAGAQIEAAAVDVRAARSAANGLRTGDFARRAREAESLLQEAQRALAAVKPGCAGGKSSRNPGRCCSRRHTGRTPTGGGASGARTADRCSLNCRQQKQATCRRHTTWRLVAAAWVRVPAHDLPRRNAPSVRPVPSSRATRRLLSGMPAAHTNCPKMRTRSRGKISRPSAHTAASAGCLAEGSSRFRSPFPRAEAVSVAAVAGVVAEAGAAV